ncbi:hypothetical protein [Paenibacillus sp. MMO-177]|uniref:hypothetical protein n=1 Tax=Paenibacillus sp. MMO-177 TaxID=3081289 RepID=UPI003015CF81
MNNIQEHGYNRNESLLKGDLIDITPFSSTIGIPLPVHLTKSVWKFIKRSKKEESSLMYRIADFLLKLRHELKFSNEDRIEFTYDGEIHEFSVLALQQKDAHGNPVLSVKLIDED